MAHSIRNYAATRESSTAFVLIHAKNRFRGWKPGACVCPFCSVQMSGCMSVDGHDDMQMLTSDEWDYLVELWGPSIEECRLGRD